jgi:hypothetical protein
MDDTKEQKYLALNNLVNSTGADGNLQQQLLQQQSQLQTGENTHRQLYSPTPKELAYALYILEHVFPTSFHLYNSNNNNSQQHSQQQPQNSSIISITGQDAVAFLTTSGIHRLILRILWTVVDPNNVGTLTQLSQLHTILRLVALTQAGHVEPELLAVVGTTTNINMPLPNNDQPTPVQVVWNILNKTRGTIVSIAKFDAVPMPSHEELQQRFILHQQARGIVGPAPPPQHHQQEQHQLPPLSMSPMPPSFQQPQLLPQGMAAFDVLAGSQDMPLPSLSVPETTLVASSQPPTMIPSITPFPALDDIATSDEFGGFKDALPETTTTVAAGIPALDAIGSVANSHLPAIIAPAITVPQPIAGVALGDFAEAAPGGMTAFGAGNSLMPLAMNTTTTTPGDDDDEFGGFNDAPATTIPVPESSSMGLASSIGLAALDALGPIENAPLPALLAPIASFAGSQQQQQQQQQEGGIPANPQQSPGFLVAVDAIGNATNATFLNLQQPMNDEFGGFTDAVALEPAEGDNPLDALGPVQNAPLPTLGGFNEPQQQTLADEDDDFGGFTDAHGGQQVGALTNDDIGGFGNATAQQQSSELGGMAAFDALAEVQDAPLPSLGMRQPQSERGLSTATQPLHSSIQASASFPGMMGSGHDDGVAAGMSALDAIGLISKIDTSPSFGTGSFDAWQTNATDVEKSTHVAGVSAGTLATEDPNDMSFGSFTDGETPTKRRLSRSLRRGSSKGLVSPETVPKDLLPNMPGEKYVEKVRQNSLKKLPELDLEGDGDDQGDPFAGLDTVPVRAPIHLNEPSVLSRASERMPQDLTPQKAGEHYVEHSKNMVKTPGGLQTLAEPKYGVEEDDFDEFESAHKRRSSIPSIDPASEPDPFSICMPTDLFPHMPGEHFVSHGASSLPTLAEASDAISFVPGADLSHLNPASTLPGQDEPMPQDLVPHLRGIQYVPHAANDPMTPGGLATVGEAFGDIKLLGLGEGGEFGEFACTSADMQAIPPPVQLHRQATPAAKDLDPITKRSALALPGGATIQEGDEEEEEADDQFGDFTGPETQSIPPPVQLHRQVTPSAKDLDPLTKESSMALPGTARIQEGDEEEEEADDQFGDFTGPETQSIPPPVQLHRQVTPSAKDLDPLTKKSSMALPGTARIQEGDEEEEEADDQFGDFTGPETQSIPPPVQLHRQATPAAKDLDPLTKKSSMALPGTARIQEGDDEEEEADDQFGDFTSPETQSIPPPVQLHRQATPAAKDLDPLTKKSSMTLPGTARIQEGEEEEEEADDQFGDFTSLGTQSIPPPVQLHRQATPAAKDLDPLTKKTSMALPGTARIQEGDEEEEEADDQFGDFTSLGTHSMPPPVKLHRQATPAAKDLDPLTKKITSAGTLDGMAIQEADEDVEQGGDSDSSTASPDPFSAFDSLDAPQPTLPPLSTFAVSSENYLAVTATPLDLSRQATPAVHELQNIARKTLIPGGMAIAEGDEEEHDDDDFGDFDAATESRRDSGQSLRAAIPTSLTESTSLDLFALPTPLARQTSSDGSVGRLGSRSTASLLGSSDEEEDEEDEKTAALRNAILDRSRSPASPVPTLIGLAHSASITSVTSSLSASHGMDETQDGFGDFAAGPHGLGVYPGPTTRVPAPSQLSRQATPAAKDLEPLTHKMTVMDTATIHEEEESEDDFGIFEASAAPPPSQLARQVTPAANDLALLTTKASGSGGYLGESTIEEGDEDGEDTDDFGDFAGASSCGTPGVIEIAPPTHLKRRATPMPQDLRPDFPGTRKGVSGGGLKDLSIEESVEEEAEFGDFGDFEGGFQEAGGDAFSEKAVPTSPQMKRKETPRPEDLTSRKLTQAASIGEATEGAIAELQPVVASFGDFGSFEQAQLVTNMSDEDDDFGGFAAAVDSSADEFGGFASFSAAVGPTALSGTLPTEGAGDWDAFETTINTGTEAAGSSLDYLRRRIVQLSQELPPPFRDSHDYGKLFDVTIGSQASVSTYHRKRAERSIQVLSLLSGVHEKLASTYWDEAIGVVQNELSLGIRLLDEASTLSNQELQVAKKPLEIMVSGMAEYIRAIRSIVASVGDMLLLDVSTPFTESALGSAWGSLPLVTHALIAETLWKRVMDKSSSLGLSHTASLETLEQIRTKCLSRCPTTHICQLSLQPLSENDKQTTKATVDWNGRSFMACSANFLANKCPFYVSDK